MEVGQNAAEETRDVMEKLERADEVGEGKDLGGG